MQNSIWSKTAKNTDTKVAKSDTLGETIHLQICSQTSTPNGNTDPGAFAASLELQLAHLSEEYIQPPDQSHTKLATILKELLMDLS